MFKCFSLLLCRPLLRICLGMVTEDMGLTHRTGQASVLRRPFLGQVGRCLLSMTILNPLREEVFLKLAAEVKHCSVVQYILILQHVLVDYADQILL